jgi:hypothetical protein
MRTLFPLALLACIAGCSRGDAMADAPAAAAVPHRFAVFDTDPGIRDPRVIDWIETDCRDVALVALPRLPINDSVLKPDLVVEFDQDGRERRRWAKPFSAEILSIQGDDLYFGASPRGDKGPFRTTPAGDMVLAAPLSTHLTRDAELITCPTSLSAFPDLSLVVCYQAKDAAGHPIRLAWEAGCP